METILLNLGAINGQVSVQIIRKNIKNVHLKVFRNLDVVLSVPMTVPSDWIDSFLNNSLYANVLSISIIFLKNFISENRSDFELIFRTIVLFFFVFMHENHFFYAYFITKIYKRICLTNKQNGFIY